MGKILYFIQKLGTRFRKFLRLLETGELAKYDDLEK